MTLDDREAEIFAALDVIACATRGSTKARIQVIRAAEFVPSENGSKVTKACQLLAEALEEIEDERNRRRGTELRE
jgi:hypothetical protein